MLNLSGCFGLALRGSSSSDPDYFGLKITPTVALSVMFKLHVGWSVGMQLADHPANLDTWSGVAVKVTEALRVKWAEQSAPEPQLIPEGELTTVPEPWPTLYTVKVGRVLTPSLRTVKSETPVMVAPSLLRAMAVMVVLVEFPPLPTSVASPDELIVANRTSLDTQVTLLVMSLVAGLPLNVPIAMNWAVSPGVCTTWAPAAGMIVSEVKSFAVPPPPPPVIVTVNAAVPSTPPILAVMVVVPELTAVTNPVEFTVATVGTLEDQVA